jgi:hypothetical protein
LAPLTGGHKLGQGLPQPEHQVTLLKRFRERGRVWHCRHGFYRRGFGKLQGVGAYEAEPALEFTRSIHNKDQTHDPQKQLRPDIFTFHAFSDLWFVGCRRPRFLAAGISIRI